MQELGNPKDGAEFRTATRQWFERIDDDLSGEIDLKEIRDEFARLKQTEQHADLFLKHFDADNDETLNIDEFEAALIHSVDTSIPGLRATDVITLCSLFLKVDHNGDGLLVCDIFFSHTCAVQTAPFSCMRGVDHHAFLCLPSRSAIIMLLLSIFTVISMSPVLSIITSFSIVGMCRVSKSLNRCRNFSRLKRSPSLVWNWLNLSMLSSSSPCVAIHGKGLLENVRACVFYVRIT